MSQVPGLKRRGSLVVRLSLAFMVVVFLTAAVTRSVQHHGSATTTQAGPNGPGFLFTTDHGAIQCRMTVTRGGIASATVCQSHAPTLNQIVTLQATGALEANRGYLVAPLNLSVPGLTPQSPSAGTQYSVASYLCTVRTTAVTCSVSGGKGFTITTSTVSYLR